MSEIGKQAHAALGGARSGDSRGGLCKRTRPVLPLALLLSLLAAGCFETDFGEPFYARVSTPSGQDFRWSDGGLPRVFDPARAAAPPDTDAVRALYEGLTDYEPSTLRPVPGVARDWESPDGGRTWLFHLREDARWSNGEAVTAGDFVRSWQRALRLGDAAPHADLLANIVGARPAPPDQAQPQGPAREQGRDRQGAAPAQQGATPGEDLERQGARPSQAPPEPFGASALDPHRLKVTLARPDANFPALVAHTVFRPVHELSPGLELSAEGDDGLASVFGGEPAIVTNGAFRLSALGDDRVVLEREEGYWDAHSVRLERVTFVETGDAEGALAAYRAGEVDAVTNAAFEPLAVKLLAPYSDFRRETFAALNYYHFNTTRAPFDDLRVRTALALAIDVRRITTDTLGGAAEPARRFLPFGPRPVAASGADDAQAQDADGPEVARDVERARSLLEEAGYPGGEGFPRVRLLINRSEQQRLVAAAVARQWREALGVETEVVIRPWEEYEAMLRAGDFDVARRSLVMQTIDEEANIRALFPPDPPRPTDAARPQTTPTTDPSAQAPPDVGRGPAPNSAAAPATQILTEADALRELRAVPLYFASSYALVKPYVDGFESNLLDAPSLKRVAINTAWTQPSPAAAAVVPPRRTR